MHAPEIVAGPSSFPGSQRSPSLSMASRRLALMAALVPALAGVAGCSSGDNPKMAQAPEFDRPPDTEPPKSPGRKESYGTSKKYQDSMNNY